MPKDLLVPLQYSEADAAALDAAAALATAHGARVAVLAAIAFPMPVASEWGMAVLTLNQADFDAMRASAAAAGEAARQRLQRAGVDAELRVVESLLQWPEETAALHARHADLALLGRGDGSRFPIAFSALLLDSGRPVLVVPADAKLMVPPRRVVLAWQPRREAARAIHDALALLPRDVRIDVLVVDPEVGETAYGDAPGADIAAHLARHGAQVQVVSQARDGRSTGTVIIDHATAQRADLIVMGGYGHSRWREQVLGGATRAVLEQATLPVLFAH
ncbi:MAG TPA: universal stress protein [Arenimonas sp.]|uniref:universal stress protein n=1 Tax=Arenimonas sp. TaxID=1872635 RepID=UPI002D7E47FA|nr:universal stress protein [Arenimonas sp.]HEU0153519.1 universal stress protein [Arenimonas sp.]